MQGTDETGAPVSRRNRKSFLKRFNKLGVSRFSRTQLISVGVFFAVIGGATLYVALAATTTVTYKASLTPERPINSYSLSTGAGQATVTLRARTRDLTVVVRDNSGNTVKKYSSNGQNSVGGSFDILNGTYRFEVSSPKEITTSKGYFLTVSYPLQDTKAPTAIINSPSNEETVSGTTTIAATATDDTSVAKVDFYVGNTLVGSDTDSPYAVDWDTTKIPNGNVTVTARSFDTSGNTGEAGIVVLVQNSATTNTSSGGTTSGGTTSGGTTSGGTTTGGTTTGGTTSGGTTTGSTGSTSGTGTTTGGTTTGTTVGSPNLVNVNNPWTDWSEKPVSGFDTSKAGQVSVTPGAGGIQTYLTTVLDDGATYMLNTKTINGGSAPVKIYIRDSQFQWLNIVTTDGKTSNPALEISSGQSVSFIAPAGNDGFIIESGAPYDGSSSTFSIDLEKVTVAPPSTGGTVTGTSGGTVTGSGVDHNITVHARGWTGEETMELRINGTAVGRWNPPTTMSDYNYIFTGALPAKIEVAFVDDGLSSQGADKNVSIEYLLVDNVSKYLSTDPGVYYDDFGNYGGVCADGYLQRQDIYCNGSFTYTLSGAGSTDQSMSTPDATGTGTTSGGTTSGGTTSGGTTSGGTTSGGTTSGGTTTGGTTTGSTGSGSTYGSTGSGVGSTMPGMSPTGGDPAGLLALKNTQTIDTRYPNLTADQVWQHVTDLTSPGESNNNGSSPEEAQFRATCHYSHLLYDDPIVYPGQPGKAHLHMFYGNTDVNAYTTDDTLNNSGSGSCQGYELNRTGYWMPAVFDGQNKVRVPYVINMYYKTRKANEAVEYPVGLKMIADKQNSGWIGWACYDGSGGLTTQPYIPNNCPNGTLTFAVYFPQCWDGRLDSPDHKSHLVYVDDQNDCPADHPKRLVQYSLHAYFKVAGEDMSNWYISSDASKGESHGGSIHADWYGGWNQQIQDVWFNHCIKQWLNCSIGQLGAYPDQLARRLPGQSYPDGVGDAQYPGPTVLTIPTQ